MPLTSWGRHCGGLYRHHLRGIANLIFLPFGNRYKGFAHQIRHYKEMTLTGILCIVDGESQQRLQVTLEPYLGGHGGKRKG